jgi:hypothetical protein
MAIPYTFAGLSGNVPASYLDSNFTYLNISPSLTSPTAVTPPTSDNSTLVATTAYVQNVVASGSVTSYTGFRNRIINGDMRIDQRNAGASQTITAAASAVYTVDRFYATCTAANVTGQRVAGSGVDQYVYQFTGASSVTAIAFGQRIEATNIYDQEGGTVTLGVKLANSLLTTVTWTAYYPTSTDTWTSRTSIATGTFTVTSTLTKYTATISLPSNVVAGLEIELSVGAQISGTWQIAEFQVEPGSTATPFERVPIQVMLAQAQRYYYSIPSGSPLFAGGFQTNGYGIGNFSFFPVTMRATPTISNLNSTLSSPGASNISPYGFGFNWTSSGNYNSGTYYYNASAEL